jgi:hypothetical protein
MQQLKGVLRDFLVHLIEHHTDSYGHLEVCESGDELDPTYDRVVDDFIAEMHAKTEKKEK